MFDNFTVKKVYEDRTYERYHFTFMIKGKQYKGSYHENKIRWHYPHPKQVVGSEKMHKIESDVNELLVAKDVASDLDGIEVKPFLNNYSRESYDIKLKVDGDEFRGMYEDETLEWFHPKPTQKLEDDYVEVMEKQVHEKVKTDMID